MNRAACDNLPVDLRKVIDDNRGVETTGTVATNWASEMKGEDIDGVKRGAEARSLVGRHANRAR